MKKNSINNKLIVFESNPDFSDNSRGFWEYINRYTDYSTFWIVKDLNMLNLLKKTNIDCALIHSDLANQMIDTAKFLVTSSFEFAYSKKKEQIHISTWHGFPLKLIGFFDTSASIANDDAYLNLKVITTQCDIITAPSRFAQLTISGLFSIDPRKVKQTGFPRNDIIFNYNGKTELKKITDIDIDNSKLILYLPTMRKGLKNEGAQFDDNIFNYPDYDPSLIDNYLEKNNAYIFTKLHFADNEYFNSGNFKLPKRLIFLDTNTLNSKLLTIYHIMSAFDILITDYSSVYVDYLLLDRPIIFSCPDLLKYKNDRGFIADNPETLMPGVIVKSQNSLIKNIDMIFNGNDEFKNIRNDKFSLFHTYKDANSSNRLLLEMKNLSDSSSIDFNKKIGKYYYPEMSPLYQYTLNGKADFYFDKGNGFEESTKITKQYTLSTSKELLSFEIDIPENTKYIRFDPDETGRWILDELSILLDNDNSQYSVLRGKLIDKRVYLDCNDPQILIDLMGNHYKKLNISYLCIDLFSNYSYLFNKINHLEKHIAELKNDLDITCNNLKIIDTELTNIINSKSWKITKPLRFITNLKKK